MNQDQIDVQHVLDDLRRQVADRSIELAIANARIKSLETALAAAETDE